MISTPKDDLNEKLKIEIRQKGPIALDHYMSTCLMDPEFGYYRRTEVFGEGGDFITAPEISQVFGELLGLWTGVVWQSMGCPTRFNLVELGPGRGTMMMDALRALKIMPGALDACHVNLIEISQQLRHRQKKILSPLHENIFWHDNMATLPSAPTIILANEFLDVLPIRQFVRSDQGWHERLIGLNENGAFEYVISDNTVDPPIKYAALDSATTGDIIETRDIPQDLLPLDTKSGGQPFAALFIDYGHLQSAVGDTFQAVRDHAFCHPLECPGAADLTAHVDFEAFAKVMSERHYAVEPPRTQAEFLGGLGIIERAQHLMEKSTMTGRNKIENQIARLISPDSMGARFKVMAVRSPDCPPVPGFGTEA